MPSILNMLPCQDESETFDLYILVDVTAMFLGSSVVDVVIATVGFLTTLLEVADPVLLFELELLDWSEHADKDNGARTANDSKNIFFKIIPPCNMYSF